MTHQNNKKQALAPAVLFVLCALARAGEPPGAGQDFEWSWYGGDSGGTRYAPLSQIDRRNVQRLQLAWTYRTGELGIGLASRDTLGFASTPILVRGVLYLSTPTNIVIALDAATGRERWRFDPKVPRTARYPEAISRGVTSWADDEAAPGSACAHRIFIGTLDARLLAIDGATGRSCESFGVAGAVDLAAGVATSARGAYSITSPPAVYRDMIVVGSSGGADATFRGRVLRAFDARSGMLRWSWRPDGVTSSETSQARSGVSAWSLLSVDTGRRLLFVPTGSAGFPFFGGTRPDDDVFANSLLALSAETGETVWHRQLIHHDLWNFDLAAQPMLIEMEREGRSIPAVVQATRTGLLFVFDRESGEPVFEVVERRVPPSDVPGEKAAATQPFPATPALLSHAAVTSQDAWGVTIVDRLRCRRMIEKYRSEGIFTPPSTRGTIASPSAASGVNWGSLAFDPERQLVIAAASQMPMGITLMPRAQSGQNEDKTGAYTVRREALVSPLGFPCVAPPWGTLTAVDLRRNTIRWQVMLGSTRDSTPWFIPPRTIGMPNLGGPVATAGGLVFIGAATDNYLRAFDTETGRELWKGRLPAGGQATPMTYEIAGRQFVVIAAGGNASLGTTPGDYVAAFALQP